MLAARRHLQPCLRKLGLSWRWTDQQESCTITNFSFHVQPMRCAETPVCTCKFLQVLLWEKLLHLTDSRGLAHAAISEGKKFTKYKNNSAPKTSGISLLVTTLMRHTLTSHASGSPSGFVSGHTSCSRAAEGCGISQKVREETVVLTAACFVLLKKRTQNSLEATL